MQRWDSVEAIYQRLESALQPSQNSEPTVAASEAASLPPSQYAQLVAPLSSEERRAWLAAVQQCQRDATMLQSRQHSTQADNDGASNDETAAVTDEETIEKRQQVVLGQERQQLQCGDAMNGDEAEQLDDSMGDAAEKEAGSVESEAAAKPRKRKKARRQRTKGEWGEIIVPARKRTKRQAHRSSRATDEQRTAAETTAAADEHSAGMDDAANENDTIQHERIEAAAHNAPEDDSSFPLNNSADEQQGDSHVDLRDGQPMESEPMEAGNGTAAATTLHSRWKRPNKRLVRFRVVAGEEEQPQIEAQQAEYMSVNEHKLPHAVSHQPTAVMEQQQQSTLVTTDSALHESVIPSTDIATVEQTGLDRQVLHSSAAPATPTEASNEAPVDQPSPSLVTPPAAHTDSLDEALVGQPARTLSSIDVGAIPSSPQLPPPSSVSDRAPSSGVGDTLSSRSLVRATCE